MIARATSCYGAGILASLFGVFWVNFAFTYPYLTLNFTMSGYPITFLGMALISSLSSSICIMITKQNVQLQEKDRMLLNAEKETMRANLMRAMSHDLRTPLTSIIGSSSTYLAQEEYMSPEEKRKLVRNIEEEAQGLLNMVENLLSVTRIQDEKGVASVVKADESLEEVISESVQRFRKRFPDVDVYKRQALYVISNSAEGINPNWERSIFDIYSECAPVVGKVMLEAMAAINPETMNCHCGENIIEMPKACLLYTSRCV